METSRSEESDRFSGYKKQTVRSNLKQVAKTLAAAGPNSAAFSSVRKGLDLRKAQGYAEDVSFAHLLKGKPEAKSKVFRSGYAHVSESFTSALDEASSKSDAESEGAFDEDLRTFLVEKGITVAWLQRDEFESMPESPTITYHPLTEEAAASDEAEVTGFKPVDGEEAPYTRVTVDANYIENNPTLVVRPCEIGSVEGNLVTSYCDFDPEAKHIVRPETGLHTVPDQKAQQICQYAKCGGGGSGGGGGGGSSGYPNIDPEDVFEVELADFQCDGGDTDGVVAGGPEIRVYQGEPVIESDGSVSSTETMIPIDSFSDSDCDNHEWQSINVNWDGNWDRADDDDGLLVIDHDDLYSGSYSVNLGVDAEYGPVSAGFETEHTWNVGNNDKWIKTRYARAMFTGGTTPNWENCTDGSRDGRCIHGGSTYASFTFQAVLLEDN